MIPTTCRPTSLVNVCAVCVMRCVRCVSCGVCGVCGVVCAMCAVKGAYAEGLAVDLEVLPIAAVGGAAVDETRIDPSTLPPPPGRPTPRHRSCAAHDKYLIFILYD